MTCKITNAILAGDVDGAVKLISEARREDLIECCNSDCTALHAAVSLKNLKVLDALLKQPHFNKNVRYGMQKETPLLLSLTYTKCKTPDCQSRTCSDNLVIKLIESGCDIHVPDSGHRTPLSLAIKRGSMEVARLLIQRGADVDAKDDCGCTPLHEAVTARNYEAMCMLLYHGASANEPCFFKKKTAFMLALEMRQEKMQETLLDFVSDFTASDSEGRSILWYALKAHSSLCKVILSQCGDLNDLVDIFTCWHLSLFSEDASIFKHICTSVSHPTLLRNRAHGSRATSFVGDFYAWSQFNSTEFVECLFLILDSECAVDFVGEWGALLVRLMRKLEGCGVGESERVSLLYLLFAAGTPVHYHEFSYVYETFGFGKELEAILLTRPEIRVVHEDRRRKHLMASNIFYGSTDAEAKSALRSLLTDLKLWEYGCVSNLCKHLQFFTLDVAFKNNYVYDQTWLIKREDLVRKLAERNVGSLVELSRDKIRKTIISNKLNTYEIYDAIRCLPVPKSIQDILHLKKPLYL